MVLAPEEFSKNPSPFTNLSAKMVMRNIKNPPNRHSDDFLTLRIHPRSPMAPNRMNNTTTSVRIVTAEITPHISTKYGYLLYFHRTKNNSIFSSFSAHWLSTTTLHELVQRKIQPQDPRTRYLRDVTSREVEEQEREGETGY
jgi:hypothetical protein